MDALTLELPESLIAVLAERAATLISDRLGERLEYFGTDEAAAYLGWPRKRIDNLAAARKVPFRQDVEGGKRLFTRQDIDLWIQGLGGVSVTDALANR